MKERIYWDKQGEKRRFLAASHAFTHNWRTIAKLFAAQYPEDLQISGSLENLRDRISKQYGEAGKRARTWDGIPTDAEYYETEGIATTERVAHVASQLGIQLAIQIQAERESQRQEDSVRVIVEAPSSFDSSVLERPADHVRLQASSSAEPQPRPRRQTLRAVESDRRTLTFTLEQQADSNGAVALSEAPKPGRAPPLALTKEDPSPFEPVSKELAHPILPTMLGRFYYDGQGFNHPTTHGYVARSYVNVRGAWDDPEPHDSSRMFTLVGVCIPFFYCRYALC